MTALWRALVTPSLKRSSPSRPSTQPPDFNFQKSLPSSFKLLPTSRFNTDRHWLDTTNTFLRFLPSQRHHHSTWQTEFPALSHSAPRFSQPLSRDYVRNSLWIYSTSLTLAGSWSSKLYPEPINNCFQLSCSFVVTCSSSISSVDCWQFPLSGRYDLRHVRPWLSLAPCCKQPVPTMSFGQPWSFAPGCKTFPTISGFTPTLR
jgi:hypothetical protein